MNDFISGLVLGLFCGGVFATTAFILATIFRIRKIRKEQSKWVKNTI